MTKASHFGMWWFGCAAVAGLAVGLFYFRSSPDIHYVVPKGFRGAILIYTNKNDGIVLKSESWSRRYVISIPEDGVLAIRGDGPFYDWYSTTAAFDDGRSIPLAHEPSSLAEGVVAFWPGGARSGGFVYDFIGTAAEAAEFRKRTAAGDVTPGRVCADAPAPRAAEENGE